jgi:hypothetical protein
MNLGRTVQLTRGGVECSRMSCRDTYVVVQEFQCDVGAVCPDQRVKLGMDFVLSECQWVPQGFEHRPFEDGFQVNLAVPVSRSR